MLIFTAELLKYAQKGEKTGWNYIEVPLGFAEKIKPGNRKGFRVRGSLDTIPVSGLSLVPVGEGNLILPLRIGLCKQHQ
ncbi:protein of unknown function [bacterium A37T11]|nr:protein of unknown function [bacterium A37T11]